MGPTPFFSAMYNPKCKYVLSVRFDQKAGCALPANLHARIDAAKTIVDTKNNDAGSGALLAHVLLGESAYYPNMVSKASFDKIGHDPVQAHQSGKCCYVETFGGCSEGWWCEALGRVVGTTGDERPTDEWCWAPSYFRHCVQAKQRSGAMIQIVEGVEGTPSAAQRIEAQMAGKLGLPLHRVHYSDLKQLANWLVSRDLISHGTIFENAELAGIDGDLIISFSATAAASSGMLGAAAAGEAVFGRVGAVVGVLLGWGVGQIVPVQND